MSLKDVLAKTNADLSKVKEFNFGAAKPSFADAWSVGDVSSWIPSGLTELDNATGGGLPLGRITELFSEHEGEGKTTLALHFVKQVQQAGGVAVWMESESALDKPRAARIGVDMSRLVMSDPESVEDGFEYVDKLVQNLDADKETRNTPTLIVWDTIAAAPTRGEVEGDPYKDGMTVRPRIISAALRRYSKQFFKYKVHFLILNQSYTKIGERNQYITSYETPGGKGLKFYSTLRLKVAKKGFIGEKKTLTKDDPKLGIRVEVTVIKNKLAVPYKKAKLALYGHTGYSDEMSLAYSFTDEGTKKQPDMISGSGWYTLPGEVKAQWSTLPQKLAENPNILSLWRKRADELCPLPSDRKRNPESGWVERIGDKSVYKVSLTAPLATDVPAAPEENLIFEGLPPEDGKTAVKKTNKKRS